MVPPDLQERGRAIWSDLKADTLPASLRAQVQEACRLADSLDRLDGLLVGRRDSWVEVLTDMDGNVSLVIDKLLGERRQYALAFATLIEKLHKLGVATAVPDVNPQDEADPLDELGQKRAKRFG